MAVPAVQVRRQLGGTTSTRRYARLHMPFRDRLEAGSHNYSTEQLPQTLRPTPTLNRSGGEPTLEDQTRRRCSIFGETEHSAGTTTDITPTFVTQSPQGHNFNPA